jgi:aspartyl-tRNA(Asn)/glutamyl-tRNA(Gln) amidotransferase subunit A
MTDFAALDADALASAFRRKTLSPVEVARDALDRAEACQATINAFTTIDRERTLDWARDSERRWRAGNPRGPHDGVGVTIKDNMAVMGWPSRKGSKATATDPMTFDAPVVARCKEAGLVILGTTTMPEFGWIGLSSSPVSGHTRNPWHLERTAGGSTSGGAAAAALGIGRFHLGSDGLGSIRIPSAFCGVAGIKPTFGRVPAYPISVMGELAHLGPLAPTVKETAQLLTILSGPDLRDPMAWNTTPPDFSVGLADGVKGLRIAYSPRLGFATKVDPAVDAAVKAAVETMARLGADVIEVDPPGAAEAIDLAWEIWDAGAALALQPFDAAARAGMDEGLVACAVRGQSTPATALIDALLYRRTRFVIGLSEFFADVDLILTPTMPTGAIPLGADLPPAGFAGVASWSGHWTDWSPFTPLANLTQCPAGTVPCGLTPDGLPIGLQFIGPRRADATVLRAMRAFEADRGAFPRPNA